MLLSRKLLRQIIGALWLIDGILQLQPQMFTMNMVNGVMVPTVQSQPGPVAASLQWVIAVTTQHLVVVNLVISIVQIILGLLLILGLWVRTTVIATIVWSLIVWYAGEGMSMLFTGQAGVLSGAPGAVLLYPLLAFLIYPTSSDISSSNQSQTRTLLSQIQFRWVLAGFWLLTALLQLQPYWWASGQISQTIGGMTGQGGLNNFVVDPVLNQLAAWTLHIETPLNIALIIVSLALAAGIAFVKEERIRPWLVASIVVSFVIWWGAQGLGMILTGMATDFNSGLLLIVMSLACWPRSASLSVSQEYAAQEINQPQSSVQTM